MTPLWWRCAVLAPWLLISTACSVNLNKDSATEMPRNQCEQDSDCGDGSCQSGVCVAHDGRFPTMLLEIAPPLAATGVGGIRFLRVLTDLERSSDGTKIEIDPTTVVHGFVPAKNCDPQDTTFPVKVTLTPREESYGLPAVSYVAQTGDPIELTLGHPCVQTGKVAAGSIVREFVVAVPSGDSRYDVYVEPLSPPGSSDGGGSSACVLVPQLFRNQPVAECFGRSPIVPRALDVVIPWPETATGEASLDGWRVDVVHPVTGHVLSNPVVLRASDRGPSLVGPYERADVRFAPVANEDPGKVLVRLTPPDGVIGPVVQAELSALSAAFGAPSSGQSPTKAVFPPFGPFPAPVTLDSWVYQRADSATPVAGGVSLTATSLDGIKAGIFASFSTNQVVGADGKLRVRLLPGTYRARVVPSVGLGLAASETSIDVACEHDPLLPGGCAITSLARAADAGSAPRAGKVLLVSQAAQVTGRLGNAADATVEALPAAPGPRQCGASVDAAACAGTPLGVLDLSLGEDAFVPRAATALVKDGRFALTDMDCGACPDPPGASFDISVRPPDGSRFAWLLEPGVTVDGNLDLGDLVLPLPIIHRGVVEIPRTGADSVPIPSALISAYLMMDQHGVAIDDPTGLLGCSSGLATTSLGPSPRCIRSVLQVAKTRAAEDGTFELVLPSSIQ